MKTEYYQCSCSCSVIVVTTEDEWLEEGAASVAIYRSSLAKKTLWHRIKLIWWFLRGTLTHDDVILSAKDIKRLKEQLGRIF